jgi:tubulin alpha
MQSPLILIHITLVILCMLSPLTMALKTVAITGSNKGLGLEICRQLNADETVSKIFALCRKTSDQLDLLASSSSDKKVTVIPDIDVTSDDVVAKLQSVFHSNDEQPTPIHVLIQNAGAYGPPEFESSREMYASQTLDNITMDRMRFAFELNTLAPLKVTKALLPNLKTSLDKKNETRKVIIISSLMGSIADNDSGSHYGYRAAKAAVNMVGKTLAVDLTADNIAVGLVHPGYVYTGFQGEGEEKKPGQWDVEPATKGVLEAIGAIDMDSTGSFLHGNYGQGVKPLSW